MHGECRQRLTVDNYSCRGCILDNSGYGGTSVLDKQLWETKAANDFVFINHQG